MAVLNEDFDFQHAPEEVRLAFRTSPQKVEMHTGKRLFRMITTANQGRAGNGILTGQWWFDESVWNRLCQISARTGSNLPQAVYAKLAVTKQFSPQMEYRVEIVLTRPVFAWRGLARWQFEETSGVTLIGGLEQYFIPSLAASADGLFSKFATVKTWAYTLG